MGWFRTGRRGGMLRVRRRRVENRVNRRHGSLHIDWRDPSIVAPTLQRQRESSSPFMPIARPIPSSAPRRRIRTMLLFVGAVIFLFEEWIWVGCNRVFRWLSRFGLLRWLDTWLVRLAPAAALVVLCIPSRCSFR